jgi:hypothetical protein
LPGKPGPAGPASSSRLLPQRFAQFLRALSLRFEQPHVLDRDRRLVGERSQQSNVFVLEGTHFGPAHQDSAERATFADQRHCEDGAMAMFEGWHSLLFEENQ